MRTVNQDNITAAFAEAAGNAADPRARELLVALAAHLHALVRETRLTHAEWRAAIAALTRAADTTDHQRNEFGLLSDLLGVSSLVDMLGTPAGATSSSVLGPFHQRGAPNLPNGGDLWNDQPGDVLVISGDVVDANSGQPVAGASLDLWQNADNGLYSAQDDAQPDKNYHGLLQCDRAGGFAFTTTRFKPYTVPTDGVGGELLQLLGREAWRPAHLHVIVEAPGYRQIVTELFASDDPWLDQDAAFAVREDLVLDLERRSASDFPVDLLAAKSRLPAEFLVARMQFRLMPVHDAGKPAT